MDYNYNIEAERLLKESLQEAEKAGISQNSLSSFRTIIGHDYAGLIFQGRATNGWDENNPKTLAQLIDLNQSQVIRVIREVSRHIFGAQGENYVAYSNLCRTADCDSGNPSAKLYKATKAQNDSLFQLDMEFLVPSIVVAMVGDSVAENGWQASIWDGWINTFPESSYRKVKQVVICQRKMRGRLYTYTATLWKLERDGMNPMWFILADRPETIKLDMYVKSINGLVDDIYGGFIK